MSRFEQLTILEKLLEKRHTQLRPTVVGTVRHRAERFPVYSIEIGAQSDEAPCFGLFGGVHGIEHIGTEVILSLLNTLLERLPWDEGLQSTLKQVRLVLMPIVNPIGMSQDQRCNGNGVDLMRNAPLDADERVNFLVGGHRLTSFLPWYRGKKDELEHEAQMLINVVRERIFPAEFALTLDCHSGFGMKDRIWFPYAKTRRVFEERAKIDALIHLYDAAYPYHHEYIIEQQSNAYLTHGDLWDYLFELSRTQAKRPLIPLTLEMGSWLWIKKNPRQLLHFHGMFHPVVDHRSKRVLRQHLPLFEFLINACANWTSWHPELNSASGKSYDNRHESMRESMRKIMPA